MRRSLRLAILAAASALTACSSFGPSAPPTLRALDPLKDDVAGLLIAFDLPRGVGPMPGASVLTYTIPSARPIKAALVPADAEDEASQLPPPGNGRAYYFFALPPASQTAIRTAAAGARAANLSSANVAVAVAPGLCESAVLDPTRISISVLVAQPAGPRLAPLIDHRVLADLVGPAAKLPPCP
jgi:hypothetical protein